MAQKPQRRRASAQLLSPTLGREDDDISLTSTLEDQDPEKEWDVEDVLAEAESNPGKTYYLIRWLGYPLADCTWEPSENLSSDLRARWEKSKKRQQLGQEEAFDVQKYTDAYDSKTAARLARHWRRNAKRERLGLVLTQPFPDDDEDDAYREIETDEVTEDNDPAPQYVRSRTFEADSSSNEAEEVAHIDHDTSRVPAPEALRPKPKQSIFKDQPAAAARNASAIQTVEPRRASVTQETFASSKSAKAQVSPVITPSSRTERPSATGYQGTSRASTTKTIKPSSAKSKPTSGNSVGPLTSTASENTLRTSQTGALHAAGVARGTVPGRTLDTVGRRVGTAKRSNAATVAAVRNVFIGGTKRKQRRRLGDIVSDSTKQQSMFSTHRFRRKAELESRNMENRAPDPSQLALFAISKGPPSVKLIQDQQDQLSPTQSLTSHFGGLRPDIAATNQDSISQEAEPWQTKKKRKSVRFEADERSPMFFEPMDIDPPSPTAESAAKSGPVEKKFKLGPNDNTIVVSMDILPLGSANSNSWLEQFLEQEVIHCSHTCLANSLAEQMESLGSEILCEGSIREIGEGSVLDNVAAHLRSRLLGLYSSYLNFNLVIYPGKSEEWRWVSRLLPARPPLPEENLRYIIAKAKLECRPFLRPAAPDLRADEAPTSVPERAFLAYKLVGLDYAGLLPEVPFGSNPIHNFFLAFPNSKGDLLRWFTTWLRTCNPDCRVYTNQHAGGWKAFRAAVEKVSGVIIVHELVTWTLQHFPGLSHYLTVNSDVYWSLSEAVSSSHHISSISLNRLFPRHTALLLTPSFLTSEPQHTFELLEWVYSRWMKTQKVKLICAWNIRDYLEDLAEEKFVAREELLKGDQSISQKEIQANINGLSQLDCECRFKTLAMASEFEYLRKIETGPLAINEEQSTFIYADPSIDPNDEQSLVNWFGWWSMLRMGQFRKFHVIGSSLRLQFNGSKKGQRSIRMPKFSRCMIDNIDIAAANLQDQESMKPFNSCTSGAGSGRPGSLEELSKEKLELTRSISKSQSNVPTFQSSRIPTETSKAFHLCLKQINDVGLGYGLKCLLTLNIYPVWWTDSQMAQHYGDLREEYSTMARWFNFAYPFIPSPNKPRDWNTYIGFFYTPVDWDPRAPPLPQRRVQRHPWIAVYRPINAHSKPYLTSEVFIWDPAAKSRYIQSRVPREDELPDTQRHLIQFLQDQGPIKNPGTRLKQVWLGGFEHRDGQNSSQSPIDITLRFLEQLLVGIRTYLPAPEHLMPSRGYKNVDLSNTVTTPPIATPSEKTISGTTLRTELYQQVIGEDDELSEDEDASVIFYPPRSVKIHSQKTQPDAGMALLSEQSGKCTNRLYEEARLWRMRNGSGAERMTYEYPPTTDWYGEQLAEGRGYSHVNVEPWELIFNSFKIGSGGTAGQSSSTNSGKTASPWISPSPVLQS